MGNIGNLNFTFKLALITIVTLLPGLLLANPTTSMPLSPIEMEIVQLHHHVLPGLREGANRLRSELPLSSRQSTESLNAMISPLLSLIEYKESQNETEGGMFRVLETIINDTCTWLGVQNCQREGIALLKQKLDLQMDLNMQFFRIQYSYIPELCNYTTSLPSTFCNGHRNTAVWLLENNIQ